MSLLFATFQVYLYSSSTQPVHGVLPGIFARVLPEEFLIKGNTREERSSL